MSKYTWSITLGAYDVSGKSHLTIKADDCSISEGCICFYRTEKSDSNPDSVWHSHCLVAFIPTDRVLEIELLDNVTGEPIGFLTND
jgi:hypothetical protein